LASTPWPDSLTTDSFDLIAGGAPSLMLA